MSKYDFDLFVIGGGSGGVRAARLAAQLGARVALAETLGPEGLGGTCVNLGCIPKKLYRYAADFSHAFDDARGFGWQGDKPSLNWAALKANRAQEINRLNAVYADLLRAAGVTLFDGFARLQGERGVALATLNADGSAGHRNFSAEHILIATGGTPHVPHFQGREHAITSNEIFDLEPFPQRLVVVGGGYIACEFASIFTGLGARVTQIYRGEQVLRGFDDELRHFAAAEWVKAGLDLRLNSGVVDIRRSADGLQVDLEGGGVLQADAVLYATGRRANVQGLGLELVGVAQGAQGEVLVDAHYQTNVPGIHAVGDVTQRVQLTPVALAEAMQVVQRLFGSAPQASAQAVGALDYEGIPSAVFTHPALACVGLTEAAARERLGQIKVFRSEFKALKHTLSGRSERTLMKLVVDGASDRVVGLHMVGADAAEIVQGFAVAMKAGATKAMFDATIGIHPSAAEEFVTMRAALLR